MNYSPVGMGARRFFVLREGRKVATLFYAPQLRQFGLPLAELERAKPVEPDNPREMARRIAADLEAAKANARRVSAAAAKEVMAFLRGLRKGKAVTT